jgi:hypothetical protein
MQKYETYLQNLTDLSLGWEPNEYYGYNFICMSVLKGLYLNIGPITD